MRLEMLDQKVDEMSEKLLNYIDKVGAEEFLAEPENIRKALEISDEDIKDLEHESHSYCEHQEWDKAVKVLGYLMFFSPQNTLYQIQLGIIFMQLGKCEEAIKAFSVASFLQPDDATPLLYMGNCYLKLNDEENALKSFDECIETVSKSAYVSKENEEIKALAVEAKNAISKV